MPSLSTIALGVAALGAALYSPIYSRYEVLGFGHKPINQHGLELKTIPDTLHCEDVHYHRGLLWTGCERSDARYGWFPGLAILDEPESLTANSEKRGGIHVTDPKTFKTTRLTLEGFSGPFVTHGIDVWSRPTSDDIYIFAVNHLPNPAKEPKARSQIEIFKHKLGSKSAKHIKTVLDPRIRTPNDIYAVNETSFFVTNDHYYREGGMRGFEDIGWGLAKWSDTVYVDTSTKEAKVSEALQGLHNNNGMGHGPNGEVLIGRAAAGVLILAKRDGSILKPYESIQFGSTIDNPSYFVDEYSAVGGDASGHVNAGLSRACDLAHTGRDPKGVNPVIVWYTKKVNGKWETNVIFEDDGHTINTASAALLVGIDPSTNGGKKEAWLYVTGFESAAMVAVRVAL